MNLQIPLVFLVDGERLAATKALLKDKRQNRDNELNSLIQAAKIALGAPLLSVMDKDYLPPSGDKHDYASLARYWWPNPKTADNLPYIRRDGQTNPETQKYDVVSLDFMSKAVRDLSFAYYYREEGRLAKHAADLLDTWFLNPETKMNPNFNFAQFKPGHDIIDGHGIIESHRFRWLLDNASLLLGSEYWTESKHEQLKRWFAQYLEWLLHSKHGKTIRANPDNKGTWYAAQAVAYALFVGDKTTARELGEEAKERIERAINADGVIVTEINRTRSMHYHMFHLQAFFDLAILTRHVGIDLFNYEPNNGGSLRKALEFLLPYVIHPQQKWPYPQIDEIRYQIVVELLRRGAIYYRDQRYERLISQVPTAIKGDATLVSYLDLVEPPLLEMQS